MFLILSVTARGKEKSINVSFYLQNNLFISKTNINITDEI